MSQGGEKLSDGDPQREFRDRLRKGIAMLLAPTMLEGVQRSQAEAAALQLERSTDRYELLLGITTALIQTPSTHEQILKRYERDKALQAAFSNAHILRIFLTHSAESLVNPAVVDGQWVATSAEAFLAQTAPSLSPAEVIPRSFGLLAITKVRDTAIRTLHQELGYPIASEYLRLGNAAEDSPPTVDFTDAAHALMDQYPSSMHGCPAYTLPDPSGQAPNLLTAYWQQTTTYAFSRPTAPR